MIQYLKELIKVYTNEELKILIEIYFEDDATLKSHYPTYQAR